jgi:MFS family permease
LKGWARSILTVGRPVALLLAVQLLSGIVLLPQMSFFPIYVEEQLGLTAVFVSTFVAIGQAAGMIAAVIGGALCDALGRKGTLVLGLAGFVLGSLVYLVRAPWLALLLRAVSGLGLGFHTLGGQSYLIDAAASDHLGLLSALFNWGYTIGGAVGSPGAGVILDSRGYGAFGLALLAVSLATTLGTMAFLPRLSQDPGERVASWGKSMLGYGRILRRPTIILLGLLRFLPTCYYGMATVLNPLLINRLTGSKTAVALYTTSSLVTATLAQGLAGQAADRWGSRWPTLASFGLLVLSAVGQASLATHLRGLFVFGVLGICAAWALATLLPCLVSEATAVEERGRVLGVLHLLWSLAMIGGSMLGGALLEIAIGLPFAVVAVLNLGAIVLGVLFFHSVGMRQRQGDTAA